jgi:hypothetical protein
MNIIVNNLEYFQVNSGAHSVNTRNKYNLKDQMPTFHVFGTVHTLLTIISLPPNFKSTMNKKKHFKVTFRRYINTHSFYLFDEFWFLKVTHNCLKGFCMYIL